MGLPVETLDGIECCYLGHTCIVVNTDMRIGCDFQRVLLVELIGKTHEVRVRVTFKYIHPEQRRSVNT